MAYTKIYRRGLDNQNMKLQYYLRGLGIGILVTAAIFCILPGEKGTLSDAEIRARALELGMVESSSLTLADVQNKQEPEAEKNESTEQQGNVGGQESQQTGTDIKQDAATESAGTENTGAAAGNQGAENTEAAAGNQGAENAGAAAENQGAENTGAAAENTDAENTGTTEVPQQGTVSAEQEPGSEVIKITVESGVHSYTVAQKLEEMQLVEDAKEFDEYLCNNGYSRYIRVGTHKIPMGATWEEIARIISGK